MVVCISTYCGHSYPYEEARRVEALLRRIAGTGEGWYWTDGTGNFCTVSPYSEEAPTQPPPAANPKRAEPKANAYKDPRRQQRPR